MTEAQYNSAVAIYHPTGGHKAGKIYDIRDTDNTSPNDLTVTGGGGTRINKLGNVENIPVLTNIEPYSYDLVTNGSWAISNGSYILNETGIYGEANTAVTITDSLTTDYAQITRAVLSLESGIHKVSTWIKKDQNETRIPEIYVQFRDAVSGGINYDGLVQINTKTGVSAYRATGYDECPHVVIDRGDWWELVIYSPENTDRLITYAIRPAAASTIGSFSNTPTGSIIIGHIGIYRSSIIKEEPITTSGAIASNIGVKVDYSTGNATFLVEPTRTNYAINSQDFDIAYYSKTNATVVANSVLAPDGINMADKVTFDRTSGEAYLRPAPILNLPVSTPATTSVWIRTVSGTAVIGLYSEQAGGNADRVTVNINETWKRVSFSKVTKSTNSDLYTGIVSSSALSTDVVVECYIWGFQVESGSLSSLINTSGAIVTRTETVASVTVPTGVSQIVEVVGGVTNTITTIPATYQLPQGAVESVIFN